VAEVATGERPVPLTFAWSMEPLLEKLTELLETHQAPVYVRAHHPGVGSRARPKR